MKQNLNLQKFSQVKKQYIGLLSWLEKFRAVLTRLLHCQCSASVQRCMQYPPFCANRNECRRCVVAVSVPTGIDGKHSKEFANPGVKQSQGSLRKYTYLKAEVTLVEEG